MPTKPDSIDAMDAHILSVIEENDATRCDVSMALFRTYLPNGNQGKDCYEAGRFGPAKASAAFSTWQHVILLPKARFDRKRSFGNRENSVQ